MKGKACHGKNLSVEELSFEPGYCGSMPIFCNHCPPPEPTEGCRGVPSDPVVP